MKKYASAILSLVFVAFFASSQPVWALGVDNIRFGQHGSATRVVLDLDAEADFRASLRENPLSAVVDLPMISGQPTVKRSELPDIIRDIRLEPVAPSYTRLSFMLDKKAVIRSAFLIPAAKDKPARLVIDMAPASDATFKAQLSRVHGTLKIVKDAGNLPFKTEGAGAKLGRIGNPDAPAIARPREPQTPDKPAITNKDDQAAETSIPAKPANKDELPLIMLDAGHGGVDPGAHGGGIREKDLTLSMAKQIKTYLEETGRYRVALTRDTDVFIRLAERVRIARRNDAALFVSIHADSIAEGGQYVSGASFYTLSDKASDAQTARLAARENQADLIAGVDLPTEDKEVAGILIDLATRDTSVQSRLFAASLVDEMKKDGLGLLEQPSRHAGFMVLKAPDIPSVLIELGFLSNRKEAEKLKNPAYQDSLARTLAGGIDQYFQSRDGQ